MHFLRVLLPVLIIITIVHVFYHDELDNQNVGEGHGQLIIGSSKTRQVFDLRFSTTFTVNRPSSRVIVYAADGFGNVRNDFDIQIRYGFMIIASGKGTLEVDLVQGERYCFTATGLGHSVQRCETIRNTRTIIILQVPTAKIVAQITDGFGNIRYEWPIEIIGITRGHGSTGEVEVLGGRVYKVRGLAFGREFKDEVYVPESQVVVVNVTVPTARISITVLDDNRRPIDNYVTHVAISGPISIRTTTPPKDLEVLAGVYSITVSALGKESSEIVTLSPGEAKAIQIVVPGTADSVDAINDMSWILNVALYLLIVAFILAAIRLIVRGLSPLSKPKSGTTSEEPPRPRREEITSPERADLELSVDEVVEIEKGRRRN